jgi:TRAP-type C4-dicarboxylate transport system substrate-binding protein
MKLPSIKEIKEGMTNLPEKTKQKIVEKAENHALVYEIRALAQKYDEDIDKLNEEVIEGISAQKELELRKRYNQIQKKFDQDEKAIYKRYRRMGIIRLPKI